MDKPLIIKGKKANSEAQDAAPPPEAAPDSIPQGAYGPQSTRPLITQKAWDEIDKNKTWMDDPQSRLGIRLFSRGIMGAAFFTTGGFLAKKWMKGYDPTQSLMHHANKNPLSFIAKLIDTTVGKPIEAAVTSVAGKEMGLRAVHFRPTYWGRSGDKVMRGRSLGDETINITFDFFSASIGDAWGRDIAGWFDPHVKKTWTDEQGNVKIPKAIDAALKATTRYVTYNGGEDWAVSIPYAYFMKGQRALINKASPGFKYDFDRGLNGSALKVSSHHTVGNYNLEGIIDLQNRFTAYNVGTLMYREAYDYIGNKLAGKPNNLYGAPDREVPKDLLGKAGDLMKWMARSMVKGAIIMTPAVPFFWITRTPQTKYRTGFIDPEKGMVSKWNDNKSIFVNSRPVESEFPLSYMEYQTSPTPNHEGHYDHFTFQDLGTVGNFEPGLAQQHTQYPQNNNFDPYRKTFGIVDKGLNAVGKMNYRAAGMLDKPAAWADKTFGKTGEYFKSGLGIENNKFKNFTRPMVYAAASYTPYMYAKAEFANLWDNGKMDMSAERMIDGAAHFNWGEFKAGAGEIWSSILHKPLADPEREAEAERRDKIDTSPADIFTKSHAQMEADKHHSGLKWQDRVISARPTEKTTPVPQRQSQSLAEREALRKALEELNPPTNAIN